MKSPSEIIVETMDVVKIEKMKLNEMVIEYGSQHPAVQEQSDVVDRLIVVKLAHDLDKPIEEYYRKCSLSA